MLSEDRDAWSKLTVLQKRRRGRWSFCHWQKNMANYVGVNAGKEQMRVKTQLKMQWLGEVAKTKAEQGGEGLIHLVLPLISSGCDGWLQSPTGPSITESTRTVQSASITVSFPHKADLWWRQEPLAIGFSMINTKTHPGIIGERLSWAE